MTAEDATAGPIEDGGEPLSDAPGYVPGTCNIGPEEIARRRRSGTIALGATAALWAGLALIDAPPVTRLVVGVPAAVAASGFLQARLRFCAGFGSLGLYNFGPVGPKEQVIDPEARQLDRRRAMQISAGSLAAGVMVGVLAAALPLTRR
jgi:hypothetical protein